MSDQPAEKNFNIERLFLKDLSFETPMGPDVFTGDWDPDYRVKLDLNSRHLTENVWEIVLVATVTAKLGSNTAYLIEAHYGAIVTLAEMDRDLTHRTIAFDVTSIMFPYLREVVDNVAVKGGFPAVCMSPPAAYAWPGQASQQQVLEAGKP